MQLTEHFTLEEFTHSETAQRLDIDNTIPSTLIPNLSSLCQHVLEPLRQHVNVPVIITSGYRCPELNRLVGGVSNSQHLLGQAADIIPSTLNSQPSTLHDWYLWILDNCPFDQLIWERKGATRWIHVSCLPDISKNRQHSFHLTTSASSATVTSPDHH